MFRSILILLVSISALYAQNENWFWKKPINQDNDYWFHSVFFTDRNYGYIAGGFNSTQPYGFILKTTDAGNTWIWNQYGLCDRLRAICFSNPWIGYAAGDHGTIFKTRDQGATWKKNDSITSLCFFSVCCPAAGTAYAVGDSGAIFKTIDTGNTWVRQISTTTDILNSVYFMGSDTGYAVGGLNSADRRIGTILKTTNGGQTWTNQPSGTTHQLLSVFFTDPFTGYASGDLGTILKTSDGGNTWKLVLSYSSAECSYPIFSIYFVNSETGYSVGGCGAIFKTNDSGNTWKSTIIDNKETFLSVFFSDQKDGYAVGTSDSILTTSADRVNIIGDHKGLIGKSTGNSITVFPNPFTCQTAISYSISYASHVKLEIYNPDGRLIAALVDGRQQSPGTYRFLFSKSAHPNGIYLLKLHVDNMTFSKSMILLR